jgi:hypothetical protein
MVMNYLRYVTFNEVLVKQVQKLKHGMSSKGKWEKDEAMEELKNKYAYYETIIK